MNNMIDELIEWLKCVVWMTLGFFLIVITITALAFFVVGLMKGLWMATISGFVVFCVGTGTMKYFVDR